MFIKANNLNSAINRIKTLADMDKTKPGILLNIKDNNVDVYYNSQTKAIIETIPAVVDSTEYHGKAVFDYKRLTDTLGYCIGSGKISVDNIEIKLTQNIAGPGVAEFIVVKKIKVSEDEEPVVVSSNQYQLNWNTVDRLPMNQKCLDNMACEDMFAEEGAQIIDKEDLMHALNEVTTGDARIVYISPRFQGMFASNTDNLVFSSMKSELNKGVVIPANIAKAMSNVINSIECEDVYVNGFEGPDGNTAYNLIFNADHTFSVYLAGIKGTPRDAGTMGTYSVMKFGNYQATVRTDVLLDNLKPAMSLNSSVNSEVIFECAENNKVDIVIQAVDTGASVNNSYRLHCLTFQSSENIERNVGDKIFSFNANIKMLTNIVANNKLDTTGIDVEMKEDGYVIRIGFVDLDTYKEKVAKYKKEKNIDIKERLPYDEAVEIRKEGISTYWCMYIRANS